MTNITSGESASFDVTGRWIDEEFCELDFVLNDDTLGVVTITYQFDQQDLELLVRVIQTFLDTQPAG